MNKDTILDILYDIENELMNDTDIDIEELDTVSLLRCIFDKINMVITDKFYENSILIGGNENE